jgi:hypothetical protein
VTLSNYDAVDPDNDPDNFHHRFSRLTNKAGLGHASIRITADVYGHIMELQRKAAADAISRVLWSTGD